MQPTSHTAPVSKIRLWSGRIISSIVVLFLLFDGVTKAIKEPHVIAASARLGYSANLIAGIGIILVVCTVVYAIPRSSVLGAVLLTGYLGGAIDCQLHAGNPLFECLFPVIFGVLVWGGLFLRDDRLREFI